MDEGPVSFVNKGGRHEVCFRCGNHGHFANDKKCPAKSKVCDKCGILGHFKKMCKTKTVKATSSKSRVHQVRDGYYSVSDSSESENEEATHNDVQHVYVYN